MNQPQLTSRMMYSTRRSDTRHLRYDGRSASALFGGQDRVHTFFLQQDHDELCWLRHARVAPDRVHIAGTLVEGLSWHQGDLLATPDPLDDRPFQHVDEGVRIMSMDVFHGSGGIDDADHQHLLSGQIGEVLQHDWGYNGLRV